jgi:uncharacterized membrane protein
VSAVEAPSLPIVREVALLAAFGWIASGWGDLRRAPQSLTFGLALALMGWLLLKLAGQGAVMIGLTTGFLLLGPFLATGIYALSRQLERGERPQLWSAAVAWRRNPSGFLIFGAVLALLLLLWTRVSVVLIALFFLGGFPTLSSLADLFQLLVEQAMFVALYFGIGMLFAALVFAVGVVSLPLMLDRREMDAFVAVVTSLIVLGRNFLPLLVWATLIVLLTAIGFATLGLGLVLVMPLLGHATWHAYRALVAAPEQAEPATAS